MWLADYLKQLIDDYNDGVVDLSDTLRRLDFLAWKEDSKPIPEDYARMPREPLEQLIESERQQELMTAMRRLREVLSPDNWQIVVMIADGKTYEQIGETFGISHQAISKRLGTIRRAAEGFDEFLRKEPPQYFAGTSESKINYPMDAMKKNGKRCRIPEYLADRFKDKHVLCCLCNACHRKSAN